MREQIGEHVVAVLIPRAGGGTRIVLIAEHNLERRVRRIAREIFVRIYVDLGGMIDGEQLHLIEINRLFEGLHEAEAQLAIFFAQRSAVELDGFGRACDVPDDAALDIAISRRDPVSDDACTEHVADKFVVRPVPREERWTGAAAADEFSDVLQLVGSDSNFILQNAGRPQHADHVGFLRLPKTDGQVGRVLPEVAGRPIHFKLLPQACGKNFHLRADGALVIVQALEREAQRVVLVAAFVAEQHRRAVILRDQQIDGAVVVVVSNNDRARRCELNFVESDVDGDVFPAVGAEITEEADLPLSVFRLADRDEIDPAVVVVVDGGDAVSADPVGFGKLHLLKTLAMIVAPKRYSGRARMRKRNVHPTVVVEVENRESDGWRWHDGRPRLPNKKFSFALVFKDTGSLG